MLKQPDYLGDVGRIPRLLCVAVVGFFAVLFSLVTFVNAIGIVILAVTGQWDLVPIVAGSVAGTGLFGAGLIWVFRRLVRPRTNSGGVAVFPLRFIQGVGVTLLPAAIMGCVQAIANAENVRLIPLVLGPPVAMILIPWLVRRRQSTARSGSLASWLPASNLVPRHVLARGGRLGRDLAQQVDSGRLDLRATGGFLMRPFDPTRRNFLASAGVLLLPAALRSADAPADDPLAGYKLEWTRQVKWATVVDATRMKGDTPDEQLAAAQTVLAAKGGGIVYFPAGVYRFKESIKLLDGVVLRGADPGPVASAHSEKYAPPTRFEFPRYEFAAEGEGTPVLRAFKGIYVADPKAASNVGVVNIDINRGHVHFHDDGTEKHAAGRNRFVVGCVLRNTAIPDPAVPNVNINQKGWQRFTARHHAAIDVKAAENLLVANNRLPKSGDDNFTMNGYVLLDQKKKEAAIDGVVFDFDNRPGLYVNHYAVGGAGGMGPDGMPETYPWGFRKGTVIRDNFVFNTGRMGIGFCGDGVRCVNNVVRFAEDVWRPTATGQAVTTGASTNDNRAVEMRGWRWVVDGNEYTVHRNVAFDKKYKINDGEGLMHEDHVNSTVLDSVLTNNRGNTYLSIYKTAGIDGLLVEGNDIRLGDGKQAIASGAAIYVNADRNSGRFPCRRVSILKNTVAGGGILLSGDPSEKNVVKGNKAVGGPLPLTLKAAAEAADNDGFEVKKG